MKFIHPQSERIERYVRGKLGSPNSPAVVTMEEHLLICGACVDRAEKAEQFVQLMRKTISTAVPLKTATAEVTY